MARTGLARGGLFCLVVALAAASCGGEDDDDMRNQAYKGPARFVALPPIVLADVTAAINGSIAIAYITITDSRLLVHGFIYLDSGTFPGTATYDVLALDWRDGNTKTDLIPSRQIIAPTNFVASTFSGASWNVSNELSPAMQVDFNDASGIAQTYRVMLQASMQPSIVEMSDVEWGEAVAGFHIQPTRPIKLP